MTENSESQSSSSNKELIELKMTNFWKWIRKSEEKEDGRSINLDKRIPGFASIIAILLFLAKEYFQSVTKNKDIFIQLNISVALQVLNVVVLFIILIRGAIISKVQTKELSTDAQNYLERLEKKFIFFIKYFFAMTMAAYIVLIANSLYTDITNDRNLDNNIAYLSKISKGRNEIDNGAHLIRDFISQFDTSDFKNLSKQLGVIHESVKQIIFDDSFKKDSIKRYFNKKQHDSVTIVYYSSFKKDSIKGYFDKIQNANLALGESILKIDNYVVGKNYKGDTLAKFDSAIRDMYRGHHMIEENQSRNNQDDNKKIIILTHVITLIFNNLGALFLVYCFMILYTKTLPESHEKYENYILELKHLVDVPYKKADRKIISILQFLFCLFIILTVSQVTLEYCFQGNAEKINAIFTLVSTIGNALALSLLIGRFESTTFNSTFSVLVILYLYANIQVLFVGFTDPLIGDVALVIAFVGKCFLYLYVLWILRTGRLKYYFYYCFISSVKSKDKKTWPDFVKILTS